MNAMIKDIPISELPRERLINYGANNLSNEELLAIILRTGTKGQSVKSLSTLILSNINDITELKNITINGLKKIKGLGTVKSVTLLAALELGRRVYQTSTPKEKIKINNALDVYKYFANYIVNERQENLLAIYLDAHKRYISHKILFKGSLTYSMVSPREVFEYALLDGASQIILIHNHPSGIVKPSKSDNDMTESLLKCGNVMGIPIVDHLIVSNYDYFSYREKGLIDLCVK